MQKKLNEDFIEEYSEQFAAKISEGFFSDHEFISGQEILSVTPSKQVNFFVIKLLFNNWQEESNRLESPFFDYSAPEVKEAMVQFMNVLSRHIRIARREFEHLLQDAVRDTIFLLMDPNGFMEIEMDRRGSEELTEKSAKNMLKYLRVQKEAFSAYLLANIGIDRDDINLPEGIIPQEIIDHEIALLSEVLPISLTKLESEEGDEEEELLRVDEDDLFKPKRNAEAEEIVDTVDASELVEESDLAVATQDEVKIEPEPAPEPEPEEVPEVLEEEEPVEEEKPIEEKPAEKESVVDEEEQVEEPVIESTSEPDEAQEVEEVASSSEGKDPAVITNIQPDDEDDEDEEDNILNSKFEDPLAMASVNKSHEQVDSMMSAISVNQRFMFINELFDGDPEVFKEAVEKVDGCDSFDESVEMLVQDYAREYHWDMNSEEVKELLKIIFRRFR